MKADGAGQALSDEVAPPRAELRPSMMAAGSVEALADDVGPRRWPAMMDAARRDRLARAAKNGDRDGDGDGDGDGEEGWRRRRRIERMEGRAG